MSLNNVVIKRGSGLNPVSVHLLLRFAPLPVAKSAQHD
jgi:hypothetical protein